MLSVHESVTFLEDFSREVRNTYACVAIVSFGLATELSSISGPLLTGSILSGAIATAAESLRSFLESRINS